MALPRLCEGTEKNPGCGQLKRLNARGLCSFCYQKHQARGFGEPPPARKQRYRPQGPAAECAACLTKQPMYGKGLCRKCYRRGYAGPAVLCLVCAELKPHFARNACRQCYMRSRQPDFNANRRSRWHQATPSQQKARSQAIRRLSLARLYGITPEDVDAMLAEQGSKCKICAVSLTETRKAIDHCHRTGKVRGLLCGSCNQGLGLLQDDPEILRSALAYLLDNATL